MQGAVAVSQGAIEGVLAERSTGAARTRIQGLFLICRVLLSEVLLEKT